MGRTLANGARPTFGASFTKLWCRVDVLGIVSSSVLWPGLNGYAAKARLRYRNVQRWSIVLKLSFETAVGVVDSLLWVEAWGVCVLWTAFCLGGTGVGLNTNVGVVDTERGETFLSMILKLFYEEYKKSRKFGDSLWYSYGVALCGSNGVVEHCHEFRHLGCFVGEIF